MIDQPKVFAEIPHRRAFLKAAGLTGAAALVASCAPAATPPPTAPAGATKPAWESEWDTTLVAAKQEGKVVVATLTGVGYRRVTEAFEAAYPGITVEHAGFLGGQFLPKILAERQAGIYGWDAIVEGVNITLISGGLRENGALDPVRPALIRPDVTEDKNWHGGFEAGWQDKDKKWGYGFIYDVGGKNIWTNTDLVKEGEVKSIRDLLDPRWKGKMIFVDPRTSGTTYFPFTAVRLNVGDEIMKRIFVDQQPAISRDQRQIVESLIRGRYAIGTGVQAPVLAEFKAQGLGGNLKQADIPEMLYESNGFATYLINRAPHTNAAKLFINWLLSKDGQTAWAKHVENNSRRTDVPPIDLSKYPEPGKKYVIKLGIEETLPELTKTQEIAKALLN